MTRHIVVFPYWRHNPYLNMLYLGARADGWTISETRDVAQLCDELARLGAGDVFHLHWTSPIISEQPSKGAAQTALDTFRNAVNGALARGARMLWTVHNMLAHDASHHDLEVELARFLAASATRIIQLNPHTADAVADLYTLPADKLTTLRHASYEGIYAPAPSQEEARAALGVPTESPTVAFVGQMRAYKGLSTLLDAVGRIVEAVPDLTLLLAGKSDDDEVERIDQQMPAGVRAIRQHEYVPDAELGTWFAAADVLVFPYEKILNSGSMLVSATFGRPCILPAEPHLVAEYGDQPWVWFFEPGRDAASSLAAVLQAELADAARLRESARAFAQEYTTWTMTRDYVAIIEGLTDEH